MSRLGLSNAQTGSGSGLKCAAVEWWKVVLFAVLGASLLAIARFFHALVDAFEKATGLYFDRRTAKVRERVVAQAPTDAPPDALAALVRAELRRSL